MAQPARAASSAFERTYTDIGSAALFAAFRISACSFAVTITRMAISRFLITAAIVKPQRRTTVVLYRRRAARQSGGRQRPERKMAIDDRRDAAMTHRRNFLIGVASLIVSPAVVRAETLMPIRVWRPTFYRCGNTHGWPYMLTGYARELDGFDLNTLGLPAPSRTINGKDNWVWLYDKFPLESLPRNRVHIPLWQQRKLTCQNLVLAGPQSTQSRHVQASAIPPSQS
jgi:hypothetical protein